MAKIAVVLLSMGDAASLEGVEPYLYNLFRDPDLVHLPLGFLWQKRFAKMIARRKSAELREAYHKIGGGSPLAELTRAQAAALEARLNRARPDTFRCYVALRYTPPFTDEAVRQVGRAGAEKLVALSLYPHYTTATTGSSLWELRKQLAGKPPAAGAVDYLEIDRWPDEPAYLDALALQVRRGLEQFPAERRDAVEILFSAHGLPVYFVEQGDPYVQDIERTIAGVMERLEVPNRATLAFQSRNKRTQWIGPGTEDVLKKLAEAGRKDVLAVPISFVCDHVETLYEIDLFYAEQARALGLELRRAPSLNTEPAFIEALATLVERRLA